MVVISVIDLIDVVAMIVTTTVEGTTIAEMMIATMADATIT